MSKLIAPVYSFSDLLVGHHDPELPLPAQHYAVLKRTERLQWPEPPLEIIHDAGITHFTGYDNPVAVECNALVARLNQESFDAHIRGRRFTRYQTRSYVTVDPAEAERLAGIDHTPADQVHSTPDLEVLHVSASGAILWSDGRVTRGTGAHLPAGGSITRKAAILISHALSRPEWRTDDAWRRLLHIQDYDKELLASFTDRYAGLGISGGDEYRLERLTTTDGQTYFEISQEGGAMAEDGDSWEYYYVYDNEFNARTRYQREIRQVLVQVLAKAAQRIESGGWYGVAEAWPATCTWAQERFGVKLPLQEEFAAALRYVESADVPVLSLSTGPCLDPGGWPATDPDDEFAVPPPLDEHGWAMYLKGFAAL